MATLIRATCSDCGDVEFGTRELVVRMCETTRSGTYVFRCPSCEVPVVRPADQPTIELLVSSGCELQMWSTPIELLEPRPGGDPLGHDDLINFHDLLQADGWFDELLAVHHRER